MGDVFFGFDCFRGAQNSADTTGPSVGTGIWSDVAMPPGVYHRLGFATLDDTIGPTNTTAGSYPYWFSALGRTTNSNAYGYNDNSQSNTRSTFNTNKYLEICVKRSVYSITSEIYIALDFNMAGWPASTSLASSYQPNLSTQPHAALVHWGDVLIMFKSSTYDSSSGFTSHVFSVCNNGAEVATISVPGTTLSTWHHLRAYIKLDNTTGAITATIDGVAQSATYTGQNTVTTTSLATADCVCVSPPVADNGTLNYFGKLDNVFMSPTAYPAGRPRMERWTVSADSTLTNWAAEGTSPTTVANALSNNNDAKAARGNAAAASALVTMASYTTTGLDTNLLGVLISAKRVSNRNASVSSKLAVGMSLSGVHTMDTWVNTFTPPLDVVSTPPATNHISKTSYPLNNAWTISDLTNLKLRLLVEP